MQSKYSSEDKTTVIVLILHEAFKVLLYLDL